MGWAGSTRLSAAKAETGCSRPSLAVVRRQIRPVDRAFRVAEDEFCVLAPDQEADEALALAERALRAGGPLAGRREAAGVTVTIGPRLAARTTASDAEALKGAAEEASWAAKAAGRPVGRRPSLGDAPALIGSGIS